jgi:hypothetical protein
MNVTPYTVVMTVCFTTLRDTFPLSMIAKRSPFAASCSNIFSTMFPTNVYTSDGRSPAARFTCCAPW